MLSVNNSIDEILLISRKKVKEKYTRKFFILAFLFLLVIACFILGCSVGPYNISFVDVIKTIFGGGDSSMRYTVIELRIPKLLLAILVGIGMGMSGVIMQNLLHNDLASPGTLGVSDGSSLFVTLYVALIAKKIDQPILLPILALVGGVISSLIIFALGTKRKQPISSTKLIMTGIAVAAAYSAVGTLLMFILDQSQLDFLQRWQAGELWGTEWEYILILSIWLLFFGGIAFSRSNKMNAIALGYDTATGLGISIKFEFLLLSFLAVAMSSASVAFGGNFFFLGLIGPHIARRLIGHDNRLVMPASCLTSALIVMVSNILVSSVEIFANIPTGIFISILSVPYFLYLLLRSN